MPVFSPSQTERWLRCPALWDYSRRWDPDARAPYSPERDLGAAFHAGMAAHYTLSGALGTPLEAARSALEALWPTKEGQDSWVSLDVQWKTLQRALLVTMDQVQFPGVPLGVEMSMGEENAQLDLLMLDGQALRVVDWKYKHSLQPFYVAKTLREYEHSHQLWHYGWRAQHAHPDLTVKTLTAVIAIGGPKTQVRRVDVDVTPELLESWHRGTEQVWRIMELMRAGLTIPWKNYGRCDDYGGCDFYDLCHVLAGDESKASSLYGEKT